MLEQPFFSLRAEAEFYHRQLSDEARWYLHSRGVSDTLIDRHVIGWNGSAITLPVMNLTREVVRIEPLSIAGEKNTVRTNDTPELYGWDTLARAPARVVVTDTPLHRLILEARGFPAVCVVGKDGSFPAEWAPHFGELEVVYAAMEDSEAVARLKAVMPAARIVEFPAEVRTVEEFFIRLQKKSRAFERLLRAADREAKKDHEAEPRPSERHHSTRAERLLADVPLAEVLRRYTTLERVNGSFTTRCPLHPDQQRSFYLYPERNAFRCFGCGATGDAVDFLMRREELTFFQALERLERIKYDE